MKRTLHRSNYFNCDFDLQYRYYLERAGEETAERYAVILNSLWQAGTPIPTNDIWIAASAMEYGLRVVTTDEHYDKISQIMVEYFAVK